LRGHEALEAGGDEDAVFAGERNDVGDGAKGDEVKKKTEIHIVSRLEIRIAEAFEKGVGEFEGETDRAEFAELDGRILRVAGPLWIYQGECFGRWIGNLMMVQNDGVDALLEEPVDGGEGSGTAVNGEKKFGGKFSETILHAFLAQAVAFVHAVGQVEMHLPAEGGKDFIKERGGGDAVDIVVAKDNEGFFFFSRKEKAVHCGVHVGQQKGIGELFETGLEEFRDGVGFAEAAIQKALGEEGGGF
jgi:hypothetical protein